MDSIIKASFWTDTRVEDQPPEIKLACLWLISNPGRDLCGFTRVSNKRFTFETGLPPEILEGACKGLASSFVEVVPGVYFCVNFLRHQFGKGGALSLGNKVVVAAARLAAKLPMKLRAAFFLAYPELLELIPNQAKKEDEQEGGSIPLAENRHGVRVREGEGVSAEGVQGETGPQTEIDPAQVDLATGLDVHGIVALYPRRERVAEALLLVAKAIKDGTPAEAIATGTRAFAAVIAQLPGGHLNKFVPGAAGFFRERRWEDDPQTMLRQAGAGGGPAVPLELGGRKGTTIRISV